MLHAKLLEANAAHRIQIVRLSPADTAHDTSIDRMLFDSENAASCFHDEITLTGSPAPTTRSLLASDASVLYAALLHHRVAGVVVVDVGGPYAFMRSLCVDAPLRSKKIGRALVGHVCTAHPRIELLVYDDARVRETARRLVKMYRSHGFVQVRRDGSYISMRRG